MKKKMMKKVVSFALAMVMVLTSVLIGGVEVKADETVYTVELSAEKTSIETNGTATITAVVKMNGTEITNLTDAGLDLWFWTETAGASVVADNTGKSLTATVTSAQAGSVVVKANLKAGETWYAYDEVSVTVADASSSTPVYEVSITADKVTAEVGETVTITAVVKKDGAEIANLTDAGLDLWIWSSTTGASVTADSTGKSLTATVAATQAGDVLVEANLKAGETWYAYDDVTVTYTGATVETPVYTVEVSADKESVTVDDTVTLTAVVKKNGEVLTDLTGLELWFWADIWGEGHDDGLANDENTTNIVVNGNTGATLTDTVTLKTAGKYYIIAELKVPGTDSVKDCVTLTATAATSGDTNTEGGNTTTPEGDDATTSDDKNTTTPENEEKVVKIELQNADFKQEIVKEDPIWKGYTGSGIWDKSEDEKNRFYQLAYSSDAWLELASYCSGDYCMKMEAIAGDTLKVVQYVSKLEAGTYTMTVPVMGRDGKVALVLNGVESEITTLKGWNEWSYVKVTFKLAEDVENAEVGIKLYSDASVGGWAFVDSITLVKGVPKTGDTTNVYAYVLLMMAGLAIVGYSVKRNKVEF